MKDPFQWHSLNILIPEAYRHKITDAQRRISAKLHNQYLEGRKWDPHITIFAYPVLRSRSEEFLAISRNLTLHAEPIRVRFGAYGTGDNPKYIILHTDAVSGKKILALHRFAARAFKKMRLPEAYWKQEKNLRALAREQRSRLLSTGNPYPFHSHISIAKLESEEVKYALSLIHRRELSGKSFLAKVLSVKREENRVSGASRIIGALRLQSKKQR